MDRVQSVTELVTSGANPVVKRVRQLADRKHRRRQGAFVVDGLQPVWRAVTAGWSLEVLIVAPDLLTQPDARTMVEELDSSGVRVVRVSRDLFLRLSDRDGPSGLMAIVGGTVAGLAEFTPAAGSPVVALDRPANPGNIGTIIRTADAAGAGGLITVGASADPTAPTAVKSSMGSLFALPVAHADDPDQLLRWAAGADRAIYAVTGSGQHDHWSVTYPGSVVLLLGSEGPGLPDDIIARCDMTVRIPMTGTAESLNLATAASVVLYEAARCRAGTTPRKS